ncbi:MAG: methyltransferase [Oscillospiraceae bacterium]|nr:methyltransferase [Oscillospiraceae bacterium]
MTEHAQPTEYTIETLAHGTPVYVSGVYRFGTDAMLLSHFCRVRRGEDACDLGTGCGIIPLRWYDMGHRGRAVGVELAPEAIGLLQRAAKAAGADNILAVCADLREYKTDKLFDVVACNPPYFNGGYLSEKPGRAQQRHQITCTTADVCRAAARVLKDRGRLCLCQRPEAMGEVMAAMSAAGIQPKRLRLVRQKQAEQPWLFLLEGRKAAGTGLVMLPDLIVGNGRGGFSEEMLRIYGKIE